MSQPFSRIPRHLVPALIQKSARLAAPVAVAAKTSLAPLFTALALTLTLSACQPPNQGASSDKAELSALKAELADIKTELAKVSKQVGDIHDLATAANRPQARTLPDLPDLDAGGKLPSLGDEGATVAIVEFSDFQCPYCKRYLDATFSKLKQEYIDTGKVKYLVRNFPLSFHANAEPAAIAAYCAREQGAYWPMRQALFANMTALKDELYTRTAESLKLDLAKFKACQSADATRAQIAGDQELGRKLGVNGTPSFLIGKLSGDKLLSPRLLVGAHGYQTFADILGQLQQPQ